MPNSASWTAGDARQWGKECMRVAGGAAQAQGGILGDTPASLMALPVGGVSDAQPRPPRHAPPFRGGVPRPPSGQARSSAAGLEHRGSFSVGSIASGGSGAGTPERPKRASPSKQGESAGACSEPIPRTLSCGTSRLPAPSFATCGMPYYMGGEIESRCALNVQTPESLKNAAGTGGEALAREWTVWADTTCSRVLSPEDFDLEALSRRDISTWSDFWNFWSDIQEGRIEMGEGSNLYVFERGVKPTWEDSQAHGKWVVLIDKRDTLSRLLLLLQALLEAQSANLRHICGVQLSMRPQRDCLAIWNTKGGHSSFIKNMRSYIITTVRLGCAHKVNYIIIRNAAGSHPGHLANKHDTKNLTQNPTSSSSSHTSLCTVTSASNSLSDRETVKVHKKIFFVCCCPRNIQGTYIDFFFNRARRPTRLFRSQKPRRTPRDSRSKMLPPGTLRARAAVRSLELWATMCTPVRRRRYTASWCKAISWLGSWGLCLWRQRSA